MVNSKSEIIGKKLIDMETQLQKQSRNHMKGARHELLAATYYLQQGFNVYWPSCQHSGVDFIVETASGLKRVQVKTAYWTTSNGWAPRLMCMVRNTTKKGKIKHVRPRACAVYDILFAVGPSSDRTRTTFWEIPSSALHNSHSVMLASTTKRRPRRDRKFDYDNFVVACFAPLPLVPKPWNN